MVFIEELYCLGLARVKSTHQILGHKIFTDIWFPTKPGRFSHLTPDCGSDIPYLQTQISHPGNRLQK